MSSTFDKLNLKPSERRFVVIVGIVVFILLNAFFVWPRFGDWTRLQNRKTTAQRNLDTYQREVDNTKRYQLRLADLEKAGASVASEDQALNLAKTVSAQGALSGVVPGRYNPVRSSGGRTNQFFDEQSGHLDIVGEERALVDFLYNLGAGGSLIRVRSMSLTPDPARQRLQGSITVVASYARKAPPRVAPAATPARTNVPPAITPARTNVAPGPATTSAPPPTNAPAKAGGIRSWVASLFGSRPAPPPTTNAPPKK